MNPAKQDRGGLDLTEQHGAAVKPVAPLHLQEFTDLMLPLGPFETGVHLAVAVSGGSDSMALSLLLAEWVAARGGRLSVLSVDHGLRRAAAEECRRVGEILADYAAGERPQAIDHHILTWTGPKPKTGIMAAARDARYALLTDWCRRHDILHLAIAHQAEDQAETYLMRQAHGSGPYGLAAMPAIRPLDGVRILRPLLGISKARLIETLLERKVGWIEDPSNTSLRFERVRWRRRADPDTELPALLDATCAAGMRRDRTEREAAAWLARHGHVDSAGYAVLKRVAFNTVPASLVKSVLRDLIYTIGTADFVLSADKLATLMVQIETAAKGGLTLAGCHVEWSGDKIAIYREAAGCEAPRLVQPGPIILWDKRYRVNLMGPLPANAGSWSLGAIGEWGLANRPVPQDVLDLPLRARQALPALRRDGQIAVWPRLGEARAQHGSAGQNVAVRELSAFPRSDVAFLPRRGATSCGFAVVRPQKRIM
ncbi:tRNA lysidine(34) synthetase TilS [Dongia soli]|uniref:tRNA(Ile)-lysidine synthase n=1 Tax=Dongia soli TaxID=600628 RepID=A0ABU5EB55_9PROT|nr:tRNA lysidine(34) synthetase TilS [Dongia soli]MDY0883376.1 tRNA lysidine(34) synthetase TilS [Dongia soli]